MMFIKAASQLGVVVRKSALENQGLDLQTLCEHLEQQPIASSLELISFDFCPGAEDLENFARFMEEIGLRYVDDYMILNFDLPEWLSIGVR